MTPVTAAYFSVMKKNRKVYYDWLSNRALSQLKRAKRIKRRRKHRNRCGRSATPWKTSETERVAHSKLRNAVKLSLPEKLDLEDNSEVTLKCLGMIRRASRRQVAITELNMDCIQSISPSAALALASEIDRWNQSIQRRLVAKSDNWNPDVRKLLCNMGLFELLGLGRPVGLALSYQNTFLPFKRGEVSDRKHGGSIAQSLRKDIEATAGTAIKRHLLFDGLSEAITNVSQHAYKNLKKQRFRQWWMSAAIDHAKNKITVSFFDHGKSIPVTLPAAKFFERIKEHFTSWTDSEKIEAALEQGRSSTLLAQRGKGIQNFLEIVRAYPGSWVTIYSRRGRLRVTNDIVTGKLVYTKQERKNLLGGTLIEWSFSPQKT